MSTALIGTRKGLFRLDNGAISEVGFLGSPVTAVLRDPRDGAIYAALDHGHFDVKLHRSDDSGATFTEIAAPAYPPKPPGLGDVDPVRGEDVEWTTSLLWSLEAGHPDDPGALWCGTIPGGLFRSPDLGQSWELVRPLWDEPSRSEWFGGGYDAPGIHSISLDPRDAAAVLVGISCGGAWRTADGGKSWDVASVGMRAAFMPPEQELNPVIQDPHRLARCRAEPDVIWCQHHNGIYRSTDDARSWTEISDVEPSSFGFAVAAHPDDPDTAWFVPATSDEVRIPVDGRLVVTRTSDGGETFEALGEGLPTERAYHLIYRHAFEVDAAGTELVLGSTTGALWWSDDGGESFTTVTDDLPPIAVVRWEE